MKKKERLLEQDLFMPLLHLDDNNVYLKNNMVC